MVQNILSKYTRGFVLHRFRQKTWLPMCSLPPGSAASAAVPTNGVRCYPCWGQVLMRPLHQGKTPLRLPIQHVTGKDGPPGRSHISPARVSLVHAVSLYQALLEQWVVWTGLQEKRPVHGSGPTHSLLRACQHTECNSLQARK